MSNSVTAGDGRIELVRGDITDLDIEAFVFHAREDLQLGSGFGTAISMRGGIKIQEQLDQLKPRAVTEAVVTDAGELKSRYIVHAVGPRFQEEDLESKLRQTIVNALKAAEAKGITALALPPLGTGFYGVSLDTCATTMLSVLQEYLAGGGGIKNLTICVLDNREYKPFADRMNAVAA